MGPRQVCRRYLPPEFHDVDRRDSQQPAAAASFYQLSSAVDHNSWHGMKRLLGFSTSDEGQQVVAVRRMTADDLAGSIWVAMVVLELAVLSLFRMYGWPPDALEQATLRMHSAWSQPASANLRAELKATPRGRLGIDPSGRHGTVLSLPGVFPISAYVPSQWSMTVRTSSPSAVNVGRCCSPSRFG